MKVGIDISQIVFPGTGVATYTRNLVEKILEMDRKNEYVLFGSSLRQQSALNSFLPQANHVTIPFPPTALEFIWNRLHVMPTEMVCGKTKVFHTSDWTEPPSKAKKVTTIHDMVVFKFPGSSHSKIIAAQKRKLEWAKREEKMIIAVSASTKKDIVEILGFPEHKIKVIYEASSFQPPKQKYKPNKPYFLAVGTREPRKNLERLVLAYKKMKRKDVDLVIAGKYGWGSNKNIEGVKVLGYVSDEKLAELYSGAAAFVYPSLYEGFGIPILEAFNCGCPVITSNLSSMPEVGDKAAIYVDPLSISDIAEKMDYVLELGNFKRKELIEKGIIQSQKFSWEKAASETIKVYEELA